MKKIATKTVIWIVVLIMTLGVVMPVLTQVYQGLKSVPEKTSEQTDSSAASQTTRTTYYNTSGQTAVVKEKIAKKKK